MNEYLYNADSGRKLNELDSSYSHPNILIPIVLDRKDPTPIFFELHNRELPESGQKNLNEITGTPFKAGLAGLTIYSAPFQMPLQQNYTRALIMLAESIDCCDQSGHSQLTSYWSRRLALYMGLTGDEVKQIGLAGKLHDIGKAVVSRELLIKPGPLKSNEWEIVKRHPGYSALLMEPAQNLENLRPMVRWHHEHYDGSGYPDGLSGSDIPLGARILAVVDAYSTMIGGRAYRMPVRSEIALDELTRCRGTQFDPDMVDQMTACLRGDERFHG